MHHAKYLYITGVVTGAVGGLIVSMTAYGMLVYVINGNSVASLSVITMAVGAIIGLAAAFIVHEVSKALERKNVKK